MTCQPQLKNLPHDSRIDMTCTSCRASWSNTVRDMIGQGRMGAQFMDLLEFETRCIDPDCKGAVTFAYAGKPDTRPVAQVVTLSRPRSLPQGERLPYPVKAVVRPRGYGQTAYDPSRYTLAPYDVPQYTLPMAMPPLRRTSSGANTSGRAASS